LIKLLTSEFGGGLARVLTNWPIYVLAVVGPAGYILNQDVGWVNVRLRSSPGEIAGEIVSFLLLTAGILRTAYRVSPGLPARR
jgi:nitrate reductase NapE component